MHIRYICDKGDLDTAHKVVVKSRHQMPGTRRAYYVDDKVCVVRCGPSTQVAGFPDYKEILILAVTPHFWCVPVRRADMRRGIVASTPGPSVPQPFTVEAATVLKNFEPLTAASWAGYTLAKRFGDEQHEQATRVVAAYNSMKHPGDTSWHSADGKTVLSWWSGGRYGTSAQVWYDVENAEWAHPVRWSDVNAAADPEAVLTPALDGTLPYAYDDEYGYAASAYAGGRTVPKAARYGVWRNGKLLSATMPGLAHCERTFTMPDGSERREQWSVFFYLHTQSNGAALTLSLRQRSDGAEVDLLLDDGIFTTLGYTKYSGLLVGEVAPAYTPYTCYAIFSPDATKLLVFGVHNADMAAWDNPPRTGSGFTLTLPTAPLTHGMDPLRMWREVKSSSVTTTTTTLSDSGIPTTVNRHFEFTYFAQYWDQVYWANGDYAGRRGNLDFADGSQACEYSARQMICVCEENYVVNWYYGAPITTTQRTRVDHVIVPTVDWDENGVLQYIEAESTYTNRKSYGLANWRETGTRRTSTITIPHGDFHGRLEHESHGRCYGVFTSKAAAQADIDYAISVGSYYSDYIVSTWIYEPERRQFEFTTVTTKFPRTICENSSGDLSLILSGGLTSDLEFGDSTGRPYVTVGLENACHRCPNLFEGITSHITTEADPLAFIHTYSGRSIPVMNLDTGGAGEFWLNMSSTDISSDRIYWKRTDTQHAEASLKFNTVNSRFTVTNPSTQPYYVADRNDSYTHVQNIATNTTSQTTPAPTFTITCIPVNSVVVLGDTRWPASVLASVKPLLVYGELSEYYVGTVKGDVRTEITFTENDEPVKLNGATDGALDMTVADYGYTSPTGAYLADYLSITLTVEILETIPPIGGPDWNKDGPASPCHGLEHWFRYDISPGPWDQKILFGMDYEVSSLPGWGIRPSLWTREKKYAVAVQGVYGDEVLYNSPIFTAIYNIEKL